jgi:hypothetical protein
MPVDAKWFKRIVILRVSLNHPGSGREAAEWRRARRAGSLESSEAQLQVAFGSSLPFDLRLVELSNIITTY